MYIYIYMLLYIHIYTHGNLVIPPFRKSPLGEPRKVIENGKQSVLGKDSALKSFGV